MTVHLVNKYKMHVCSAWVGFDVMLELFCSFFSRFCLASGVSLHEAYAYEVVDFVQFFYVKLPVFGTLFELI